MLTQPKTDIAPQLTYEEFLESFVWNQGEHITSIGPTQSGKTTLLLDLLPIRGWPLVLATKPKDPTIKRLKEQGYWVTRRWPPPPGITPVCFWPKIEKPSDVPAQREEIRRALFDVYTMGGYAPYLDEIRYITKTLGLSALVELLYLQGATIPVSVVGATQRPMHIPLEAYSQATHLFLFRESDARNLQRLREISGVNAGQVWKIVVNLPLHHFLYVNTRDGTMAVSKVELKGES